jgi:SAM-dependent methyltransferase
VCDGSDTEERWRLGDRLFRTTPERFPVHRCRRCTAHFLAPVPDAATLARFYPAGYWSAADASATDRAPNRWLEVYRQLVLFDHVRFVRRVLREQRARGIAPRLLDVGGGDGSLLQAVGERNSLVLDQSPAALRSARARGVRGVRAELRHPPFPPGSFSLITMFHFLEHVQPAGPLLARARELLVPGGELVVQVPNRGSWQGQWLGRYWAGLDVPRHLVVYDPRTLRATLERHGFAIVRATHFSWRDNPTTLANSLLPGFYPPARVARGGSTSGWRALGCDLVYLAATVLATPFTWLESAFGHGAALMVQARPMSR